MPDLRILDTCPSLKYLQICSYFEADKFDYSPIYDVQEVRMFNCRNENGWQEGKYALIDFLKIKGLVSLSFSQNKYVLNYNKIPTLKSLSVGGYKAQID